MCIFEIIKNSVKDNEGLILDALNYITENAETGYREVKTSAYMENAFKALGYDITKPDDITGFYTVIDTGREGPEILVLGELDSIICPTHKKADKVTGAAHACGHHAQCAALVGIAAALKNEKIIEKLCGKIRLCAVPAEEFLEIKYRNELREKGIIKYLGGKAEFMRRGYFDGCDIALMVHTAPLANYYCNLGSVGFVSKIVTYKGKSAHAGGSPWEGINSLYAANLGLNAINALRETFKEQDIIRVHPIITSGGTAVNTVPEKTIIESYVRGKSIEAIDDANKKVNRALTGAALALGANIDIRDIPGYHPLINDDILMSVAREALSEVLPDEKFIETGTYSSDSTDMGDMSAVMPTIQPYAPGAGGISHGDDYYIAQPDRACVGSAQWQVAMLYLLLKDSGEKAKEVMKNHKPIFASKEEYLNYLDNAFCSGDRIVYNEDGATVDLK